MKLDASDARKSAGPTISAGDAMRRISEALPMRSTASGALLRIMSVSTEPGARALTRMPRPTKAPAIERVSDMRAALAPEYIAVGTENRNAPAEITLTIDAPGLASRWGSASCTRNTGPRRFTSYTLDHASTVNSPTGWVNAVAALLTQPVGEFTPDAWSKVYDVNLRGPVFLAQEALPHLEASRSASIVNVISAGAFLFSVPTAMYSGAKAALMSLTRSMAGAYAGRGIRVNALAPGSVDTDMMRNNSAEAVERMGAASLMKRIASPAEMVGPALFLASDASSFMTGQVLLVDGGLAPH